MNFHPARLYSCLPRRAASTAAALTLAALALMPLQSAAHGFAGKRFFPTTLAVDDPFVSDELSLLGYHIDEPEQETSEFTVSFAKRLTPRFGIEIEETYQHLRADGEHYRNGFGNLEIGAKYQFYTDADSETIFSVGLDAEVGGSGSTVVDAEAVSSVSPTLFFGKGFGNLPDSARFLKPLAITGTFAANFPTESTTVTKVFDPDSGETEREIERNPTTLSYGLTVQYNLHYLQSYVQDVGLKAPFSRLIPLVEFSAETCLDDPCNGETTGSINPGLIWFGKSVQLGIEAQIPLNDRSGDDVGVLLLVHFFLDDLFPNSVGRPLFSTTESL